MRGINDNEVVSMARWAARTRNGDMVGGDFPGWFTDLFGPQRTLGLADRRGTTVWMVSSQFTEEPLAVKV